MIVSGCTGSFVAPGSLGSECAESPEPEVVMYFESVRNSSAVYLAFEHFWYFAGAVVSVPHPNLLLYSCKWDGLVPIYIILLLGGAVALGVGCSCSWDSIFMGGLEFVTVMVLLVGGISQSFS